MSTYLNLNPPTEKEVKSKPELFQFLRNVEAVCYAFNPPIGDERKLAIIDFETTGLVAGVD